MAFRDGQGLSIDSDLLRRLTVRAKIEVVRTVLKSLRRELHVEKPGELQLQGALDRVRSELHEASRLLPVWPREKEST